MPGRPFGNGDGGGNVVVDELEPNWILIHNPGEPDPGRIPDLLINVLRHWLHVRPTLRVAGALSIARGGFTSAINAWIVEMAGDPPAHQEPWFRDGVVIEELAPGWIVVKHASSEFSSANQPTGLVAALHAWAREREEIQIAATLGIEENGQTTSIHAWFDPTQDE